MIAPESSRSEPITNSQNDWQKNIRRVAYLLVLLLIVVFLATLGSTPWHHVISNWPTLFAVMISTGAGIVIQAQSFRSVCISGAPTLLTTTSIWSVSALVSIATPLLAGIATRTALLTKAGVPLGPCLLSSIRQMWVGLEYALLLGAVSFPFTSWPFSLWAAIGAGAAWTALITTRLASARQLIKNLGRFKPNRIRKALDSLRTHIPGEAHLWFVLQILMMSTTYFLGFNGMGAELSLIQAIALSALTVILSLIVFVPNGLGITDALWVLVATHGGFTLDQAVAVAIVIRLSHLLSSGLIYFIASAKIHKLNTS
ncbi:MAG: flippase-like domain-containing protein [Gammaproteobacteria bacterium]|nr:flippase-like domain-containing protein [Gammaproteobacteria bacterium]